MLTQAKTEIQWSWWTEKKQKLHSAIALQYWEGLVS